MADSSKKEGFERVFDIVGGHGRFQWILMGIVSLQLIIVTWHHVGYVFLGAVPDHWCLTEELKTTNWSPEEIKTISIPRIQEDGKEEKWDSCHYYYLNYGSLVSSSASFEEAMAKVNLTDVPKVKCNKWDYDDSLYIATVVTQFDLVCGRRPLVATIQASYMAGGFVGTLIFGAVSDKLLGRRLVVLISCCLVAIAGLAASYAKSYLMFVMFRFVIAMGVSGTLQNCYVLMMEHADKKYRAVLGLIEQVPFAFGYMILPLYAYFIRDWSSLQFAFGLTSLSLVSYFWILPSSPRWLATHGNAEKSVDCLMRIAKVNGYPEPDREELLDIVRSCHDENSYTDDDYNEEEVEQTRLAKFKTNCWKGTENFRALIASKEIRYRSLVFWFLFFSVSTVYYGFVFSNTITKDPFLQVFLSGLMEVPAYTMILPFVSKLGRRPTTSATFFITGAASLGISATPMARDSIRLILTLCGKLFISAAFAIIYLLGAELYPTSMRTTGLAVGILMGRIGGITAPYISDLMRSVYEDLPSIIFGVLAILGGIMSLLLPETKNMAMYDQVRQVEQAAQEEKLKPKKDWKDAI